MDRKIHTLLLAAAAVTLAPFAAAPVALAQTAEAQPGLSDAQRLASLMSNEERNEELFSNLIDVQMPQAVLADPDVAFLEENCPGSVKAMLQAGRPELWRGFVEDEAEFKAGLVDIFLAYPPDHLAGMVQFFESPGGRKLFDTAFRSASYDATLASIVANGDSMPSEDALERDRQATERRLRDAIDPSEMADMDYQLRTAPWYPSIMDALPKVKALRSRIDTAPTTAEEDARLDKLMMGGLTGHLKKRCGIEL
ncbi:MAG: hypothetical protein H6918_09795 [Sphingomonadaceae bacterium]|nr:hypothetical protein [Sphingomonadaceae bacterium]